MKNWRKSWLSREALALGIYAGLSIGVVGFYFLEIPFLYAIFMLGAVMSGIYGIYAQSMIYRIKARPSWDRISTSKRFLGAGYLGLILVSLVLTVQGYGNSAVVILSLTLLASSYQVLVIFEEKTFYKYLSTDEKNFYQLNKTKYLLENNFAKLLKIRYFTLIIFGVTLPMLTILFLANGSFVAASFILMLSLLGSTFSELIGRYIFYVTVVPLGLAGNFFAGNQRGRDYKEGHTNV
jgi:DMSO reductase anchor subunit